VKYTIQKNTIEIFEIFDEAGELVESNSGDSFFWSYTEAEQELKKLEQ
jgi:hypothetical protein